MALLRTARERFVQRSVYGMAAYWAANLALLGAEAHWHVLTRLTLLDFQLLKSLALMAGKTVHPS
jgi:hypothetical protein